MSKVRIVQLLCPQRHCYIATVYESPDGERIDEMTTRLLESYSKLIDEGHTPRCGICGFSRLTPEDMPTRFSTIAEAAPAILELERRQRFTREFFRASRG